MPQPTMLPHTPEELGVGKHKVKLSL
jgi:hypothetical protein